MNNSYWVDEDDRDVGVTVPKDIVDISFRLEGRELPIDHAWDLSVAVKKALPWIQDEPEAAIHQIHVAASGNGWCRPEDKENDVLHLSRRTTLTLRIPQSRQAEAEKLTGETLHIGNNPVVLGQSKTKPLSNMTTLFSRYVSGPESEHEFMDLVADHLASLDVKIRKMLCGRTNTIYTPDGELFTRSIMMADVDLVDAIVLQRKGIGAHRLLGCGIVIPHKGIEAVKKMSKD